MSKAKKILALLDRGVSPRAIKRGLRCLNCGSESLKRNSGVGKCSDDFICLDCGKSYCYYYSGKKFVEGKGWIQK